MPHTIERLPDFTPADIIDGRLDARRELKPLEPWVVIVYNCDCHTFEGVIETFCAVLGMSASEAERKAAEIHFLGRSIVKHAHQEAAEHYAEAIREYSRGRTMSGNMGSTLQVTAEPQ